MLFAVTCVDKPNHLEVRLANRSAHLEFLKGILDQLVAAGPTFADDGTSMNGSLVIADFPDRAAAEAYFANDPYAKADLFESVTIRAYKKVLP
ncbi:MAG TPA: YciI family protein [Patescibacteria group bacterium]|nr:YciI family protein [Patescibacteria group bacterium]